MRGKVWLTLGGILSILVGLLHIGIIFAGPPAFRYFGAPERIIQWSESGSPLSTIMTLCIAVVFVVWGSYGFSGAGLFRPLPYLRAGLVIIAGVFTLRGLATIPDLILFISSPGPLKARLLLFSVASLIIGLVYLKGTLSRWRRLKRRSVAF